MPHYKVVIRGAEHPEESIDREDVTRIIEARNQARALAHVVADTITVSLAEPLDFMALANAGGSIETAKEST